MEDEGTTDPEGTVCDEDEPIHEPGDVDGEGEEEDCETENEPDAFDPRDWVDPEVAIVTYGAEHAPVPVHCHGDSEIATCGTQSSHVASFHSRVRAYQEVEDSLKSLRTPIAHSLAQTVNRVKRHDTKRCAELLCKKQPAVYTALRQKLVNDDREHKRMQK